MQWLFRVLYCFTINIFVLRIRTRQVLDRLHVKCFRSRIEAIVAESSFILRFLKLNTWSKNRFFLLNANGYFSFN